MYKYKNVLCNDKPGCEVMFAQLNKYCNKFIIPSMLVNKNNLNFVFDIYIF